MALKLPNKPGLQRRNAYGEYIRNKNKKINLIPPPRISSVDWWFGSIGRESIVTENFELSVMDGHNPLDIDDTTDIGDVDNHNLSDNYETLIELPNVPVGLDLKELVHISKIKICKNKVLCVICQEQTKINKDIIRILDCKHIYHVNCIDNWFIDHNACPLCKKYYKNLI